MHASQLIRLPWHLALRVQTRETPKPLSSVQQRLPSTMRAGRLLGQNENAYCKGYDQRRHCDQGHRSRAMPVCQSVSSKGRNRRGKISREGKDQSFRSPHSGHGYGDVVYQVQRLHWHGSTGNKDSRCRNDIITLPTPSSNTIKKPSSVRSVAVH